MKESPMSDAWASVLDDAAEMAALEAARCEPWARTLARSSSLIAARLKQVELAQPE